MIPKRSAGRSFYLAFGAMGRFRVWVPLALYFVLKMGILSAYVATSRGGVSTMWSVFVGGETRGQITHYPWNYVFMPVVLGRIDVGLDVLVAVIFQGAAMFLYADTLRHRPLSLGDSLRGTLARYGSIVGVSFVASMTLLLWFQVQSLIRAWALSLMPGIAITGLFVVGGLLIQGLFIYSLPLVLLSGCSVFRALRESIAGAFSAPGRTIALVGLPFVITLPSIYLATQSEELLSRLSPEILVHLQVIQEVLQWLSMFVLLGGLTALFVGRVDPND